MFGENDYYSIDNGQLTVTSFSSTRVRGSFQATATHYVFNPNPTPVGTIQVNGNFNVVFDNLVAVTFRCRLFEC